jgi:hypothetical protein
LPFRISASEKSKTPTFFKNWFFTRMNLVGVSRWILHLFVSKGVRPQLYLLVFHKNDYRIFNVTTDRITNNNVTIQNRVTILLS